MSWADLETVFAIQFADDIATVTTGESDSVMRERLSGLGERRRTSLREVLDEIEAHSASGDTHPRAAS